MSSITTIVAEVAAAALEDGQGDNPEAHALLLKSIERLQLAAEKPAETAKRILYQVRLSLVLVLSEIRLLISLFETNSHQPTPLFASR